MTTSVDLNLPVQTPNFPSSSDTSLGSDFGLAREDLLHVKTHFVNEIKNGLSNSSSSLAMLPGYISSLPTGEETGRFLLVMIDEATLGVGSVTFLGARKYELTLQKYVVDAHAKESAKNLFDFLAKCLESLLNDLNIPLNSNLPLAASLAFPMRHHGLGRGQVLSSCKGFKVPGLLGKDVAELLFDALRRKNIVVDILTIQNDTITSLLAHAYSVCSQTTIGCFIDSGVNIAYLDSLEQLPKWKSILGVDKMVFNTECGGYDIQGAQISRSEFDIQVDEESAVPGHQQFEKMTSGLYIGEIVRLVMVRMALEGVLFGGKLPNDLSTRYL
ncbi:actin-like ATPase domain-containing protein, partial [Basidiobolus meristosporus CBS 931.73]